LSRRHGGTWKPALPLAEDREWSVEVRTINAACEQARNPVFTRLCRPCD
jgi:hypothetical protein